MKDIWHSLYLMVHSGRNRHSFGAARLVLSSTVSCLAEVGETLVRLRIAPSQEIAHRSHDITHFKCIETSSTNANVLMRGEPTPPPVRVSRAEQRHCRYPEQVCDMQHAGIDADESISTADKRHRFRKR